ncbi:hypothetical protein JTE90_017929 [Oedothorax gibbosus]|uniref:LysM domain-containing protein n=1 Tax=Oedothorax gibbosus TaxID=931172 RepID=A0AAV6TQV4_9ARAC|nr:hypothetical protein JTE90_017929 [Oedothorax gibbosus]
MVENMAAVAEQTEKISLSNYAKKHVRYGSMAKESGLRSERYVKHAVQPGDTLQGLALRYGVTMEQIKRANKMWTADSLFLRSSLDIPVGRDALTVSPLSPVHHSVSSVGNGHAPNGHCCDMSVDLGSPSSSSQLSPGEEGGLEEESAADFLIRIDSHIAQTKDKVLRLQNKGGYSEDDLHNSLDGFSSRLSYQWEPRRSLNGSSSLKTGEAAGRDIRAITRGEVKCKGIVSGHHNDEQY